MGSTAASVSVVLVHGGFVDGSGWQGVYNILQQHGYRVGIVQNPTISLDDDVAVTKGRRWPRPYVRRYHVAMNCAAA